MADELDTTPYSTARPYITAFPDWLPEEEQDRVASYNLYEQLYWGSNDPLKVIIREEDGEPLYIPTPRTIVDTTAHYLLKGLGLQVQPGNGAEEFQLFLDEFLKRERFYSRFQVAKHTGVNRGDWIFHITADPAKPDGSRISLTSVDPGAYFPIYDPDDLDKRIGVRLVEQSPDPDDATKTRVKILDYWYEGVEGRRRVFREEALWKMEGWDKPEKAEKITQLIPRGPLPTQITQIPVYHYRNGEWQGDPFGSSELKGLERLFLGGSQTMTDTELALTLMGLGVYATDAGRPVNENTGTEEDWVIAPGKVLEVPGATMIKRLEGITTVDPALKYVDRLESMAYEATSTSDIALGRVDVQTAESGIALAIRFLPTQAKVEERDLSGTETLTQMFFDWKFWVQAYENQTFLELLIVPTLGDKLPLNRAKKIEELNNMLDRKVISPQFYREEMAKLGYIFPANMEQQILDWEKKIAEVRVSAAEEQVGPGGRKEGAGDTLPEDQKSTSNNTNRVNESDGTEVEDE